MFLDNVNDLSDKHPTQEKIVKMTEIDTLSVNIPSVKDFVGKKFRRQKFRR